MRLSVLTAALQELTPRAQRDADPDLAIEQWLAFAREIDSPYIQLSAARIQDRQRLGPILAGSLAFVKAIDEAAAPMYALQHEVLASQGIPIQGFGREAYRS
jgi:hypothetical protein